MKSYINTRKFVVFLLCFGLLSAIPVMADDHHENMASSIQVHLARAKQNLGETVLQSEQSGATVLEAELDDIDNFFSFKKETVVYQLITVQNGKVEKQFIDPATGKIQDSKKLSTLMFFEDDYKEIALDSIKTPMSKAIELAEETSKGKSFQAKLKERDGLYLYTIKTVNENGISTYIVDSLTGKTFKQIRSHHHGDES